MPKSKPDSSSISVFQRKARSSRRRKDQEHRHLLPSQTYNHGEINPSFHFLLSHQREQTSDSHRIDLRAAPDWSSLTSVDSHRWSLEWVWRTARRRSDEAECECSSVPVRPLLSSLHADDNGGSMTASEMAEPFERRSSLDSDAIQRVNRWSNIRLNDAKYEVMSRW